MRWGRGKRDTDQRQGAHAARQDKSMSRRLTEREKERERNREGGGGERGRARARASESSHQQESVVGKHDAIGDLHQCQEWPQPCSSVFAPRWLAGRPSVVSAHIVLCPLKRKDFPPRISTAPAPHTQIQPARTQGSCSTSRPPETIPSSADRAEPASEACARNTRMTASLLPQPGG